MRTVGYPPLLSVPDWHKSSTVVERGHFALCISLFSGYCLQAGGRVVKFSCTESTAVGLHDQPPPLAIVYLVVSPEPPRLLPSPVFTRQPERHDGGMLVSLCRCLVAFVGHNDRSTPLYFSRSRKIMFLFNYHDTAHGTTGHYVRCSLADGLEARYVKH